MTLDRDVGLGYNLTLSVVPRYRILYITYKVQTASHGITVFFSFQRVEVIGRGIDQQILVDPSVIDVGLCYLTSSVQLASFQLRNTSRVVVPYEIKLPRELSRHAELSHSKGYLKAESSMEIFVRLRLKCLYNIIFESLYFFINTQHACRYTYITSAITIVFKVRPVAAGRMRNVFRLKNRCPGFPGPSLSRKL